MSLASLLCVEPWGSRKGPQPLFPTPGWEVSEVKAVVCPSPFAKILCMCLGESEIVWRAILERCGKGKGIRSFPSGLGCVSVLECDCEGFLPALM